MQRACQVSWRETWHGLRLGNGASHVPIVHRGPHTALIVMPVLHAPACSEEVFTRSARLHTTLYSHCTSPYHFVPTVHNSTPRHSLLSQDLFPQAQSQDNERTQDSEVVMEEQEEGSQTPDLVPGTSPMPAPCTTSRKTREEEEEEEHDQEKKEAC